MWLCSVVLLMVCYTLGKTHDWGSGQCPHPSTFFKRNFDTDKFLGKWFVVKKSDTNRKCWTLTFNRKPDGDLEVVEKSVLLLWKDYTSRGHLLVPNQEQSAKKKVKFTRNIWGMANYTIVDTDHVNWALLFTCQDKKMPIVNYYIKRQSAFLIVRDLSYDNLPSLGEVRKFLREIDVDAPLDKIKHEGCPSSHSVREGPPPNPTLPSSLVNTIEDLTVPEETTVKIKAPGFDNGAEWIDTLP